MRIIAAAAGNPTSALGTLAAMALPSLHLLRWPKTVSRRGGLEILPLLWLILLPLLSSAFPRHIPMLIFSLMSRSPSLFPSLKISLKSLPSQTSFNKEDNFMKPFTEHVLDFPCSFSYVHVEVHFRFFFMLSSLLQYVLFLWLLLFGTLQEKSALQNPMNCLQSFTLFKPTPVRPVKLLMHSYFWNMLILSLSQPSKICCFRLQMSSKGGKKIWW